MNDQPSSDEKVIIHRRAPRRVQYVDPDEQQPAPDQPEREIPQRHVTYYAPPTPEPRRRVNPLTWALLALLAVIALALGLAASTGKDGQAPSISVPILSGNNTNPPEYVKQVTAYKEGTRQLYVYFVLADQSGAPTTASGKAFMKIVEEHTDYSTNATTQNTLYSTTYSVKASDFQSTKVGQGSFEHDLLLLPVGRIPYTDFDRPPSEFSGKVIIEFYRSTGGMIEGEETIFFDK